MKASTTLSMRSAVWLVDWLLRHNNDHEAAFSELMCQIAEGKSLAEYCAKQCIRQGFLLAWIRDDQVRSSRFDLAMLDRKFMDREFGRDVVYDTAMQTPDGAPTHGERLKAASILMGNEKEDKANTGVTINIVRFSDEPVQVPKGYVIDANHTS